MACAVVHPTEGRVSVPLLKPQDKAMMVQKGAAIAVMEELDEPICGANAVEADPTMTATVLNEKQEVLWEMVAAAGDALDNRQ